ncbi:retrovirus-related Pol polyprotein [Pycnococcus provasolii]
MSLFVHTDDGKFGYVKSAKDHRDKFVDALNKRFNIGSTQLNIDRIFNIKVDRRSDGSIKLSQQKYILDLMKQYHVDPDDNVTSPMSTTFSMHVRTELSDKERTQMRQRPFLSLLSALMWLSRCTRYDISTALTILSRATSLPDISHWRSLMRILKYLHNTLDYGLVFMTPKEPDHIRLRVLSDASHANDDITGRSISGIFVVVSGAILDWVSRHQPYVSLHSGEAETICASTAATHILYWQQLLEPILGYVPTSDLLVDSTTARNTLSTPIHTSQMRHIRTKLLFTRELIVSLRRELRAWGGVCSTLDYSTRELQSATFRRSASYLGKRDHPSSSKTAATTAKQPALKKLDPGSK